MMKLIFLYSLIVFLLYGCQSVLPEINGYQSLSAISQNGFARNNIDIRKKEESIVKLWGFLDTHNVSLKEGTIKRQPLWWSESFITGNAYFDLKPYKKSKPGNSVRIKIAQDPEDYINIFKKIRDAKENSTMIFVKGRLKTYSAPTNTITMVGLEIHVTSPADILVKYY